MRAIHLKRRIKERYIDRCTKRTLHESRSRRSATRSVNNHHSEKMHLRSHTDEKGAGARSQKFIKRNKSTTKHRR